MPVEDRKTEAAFVTWDDERDKKDVVASVQDVLEAYDGVQRSSASTTRTFLDLEPNRSVRVGFSTKDYTSFRSGEAVPRKQKQAIKMCMDAYDTVGMIRNIIDLMSDFSAQGIVLVHPNKTIERFYRKWFEKVSGKERSERFLNTLYRCGNVVVHRRTAKIKPEMEKLLRSQGADVDPEFPSVKNREVPWVYDFLNPVSVNVVGNEYALFSGKKKRYELSVSDMLSKMIGGNQGSNLPASIKNAIKKGKRTIPLDPEKIAVYHYKKDDWRVWAYPLIYAILDDIIMLEKMKLADLAALDGAISNIRLWNLGDLDNKILPTKAGINKLRDILASNVGGGTMDLVWGPELKFTESATQVYRFLGSEKYTPVLTSIYAGLGIPPTLTGISSNGGGGFTNNFISLKTLLERLQYGRDILVSFWKGEIERVKQAMGFRFGAEIHFDQMVLSDEVAEKNLLIQLADRDIISSETLLERFKEIPSIEKIRIKRENRDREGSSDTPHKASPYHNPQHKKDLEKIALTKDVLAPEQLGLPKGKQPTVNTPPGQTTKENTPTGRPEDGRPRLSRDTEKRKQKRVVPRNSAMVHMWATETQKLIANIVTPAFLEHHEKKNARGLSKQQLDELEYIKLCILSNIKPFMEVDVQHIVTLLNTQVEAGTEFLQAYNQIKSEVTEGGKVRVGIDELRGIQILSYVEAHAG
jgi:hypothetical protein